MEQIVENTRKLNVTGNYDTVVVGGGIAGVSAALAAARGGNKVLLCEKLFQLGGLATAGLITIYLPLCDGKGKQLSFSIAEELLRLSIKYGAEADLPTAWLNDCTAEERKQQRYKVRFNASVYSIMLEQVLVDAGVKILYGTSVCDVIVTDKRITHLIVENKDGRTAVKTGNVIDASGDADICYFAGEKTAIYSPGNNLAAWYYSCDQAGFDLSMVGVLDVEESKITDDMRISTNNTYNGVDSSQISQMMIDSHRQILEHFLRKGDLSKHMLANIPTTPQLRMTRRLCSDSEMTEADAFKCLSDSVGMFGDWRKRGPVYELPYSALHGVQIKNLGVAGRCISVSEEMWDVTRVIPVCAVSGEAIGTAAAISQDFDTVDISALQDKLLSVGVRLHMD